MLFLLVTYFQFWLVAFSFVTDFEDDFVITNFFAQSPIASPAVLKLERPSVSYYHGNLKIVLFERIFMRL